MNKSELFTKAKVLVDLMAGHRKTATLKFKDMEQKKTVGTVLKQIYPSIQVNLACDGCVLQYLNVITAWYGREFPIYMASSTKKTKIPFVGVEQKPEEITTKKDKK